MAKKRNKRWSQSEYPRVNYRNYSCPSTKVCYPTRKEAKRVARLVESQGGDLLTPYDCPDCGAIHLGHSRRRGF